jgi:act minimal PKS acyl carrier protein
MSKPMSIDDLRSILVSCAGGDEDDALHGDISGVSFEELGYDSLALIEMAATLQREHGVVISDEQITDARSPGELLTLINGGVAV